MSIRSLLLVACLAIAGSAVAHDCPNLISDIDNILAECKDLNPDLKSEVSALRDEGEQLHKDGKHDESVETLKLALSPLSED